MTRRKRRMCKGVRVPKDIDQYLDELVGAGFASEDEAQAAIEFFSDLADRETAGAITPERARRDVIVFSLLQVASRDEVKS